MPRSRIASVRRSVAVLIAAVAGVAFLVTGCASGAPTGAASTAVTRAASSTPTTFPDAVCTSILRWQNRLVAASNSFSDASPSLDPAGRKARYLRGFDEHVAITQDLRTALQGAPAVGIPDPEGVRAALIGATDVVQDQFREDRGVADALPLSAYEAYGVGDGHLFTGTEKALSTVLKQLNALGRDRNIPALLNTCGR